MKFAIVPLKTAAAQTLLRKCAFLALLLSGLPAADTHASAGDFHMLGFNASDNAVVKIDLATGSLTKIAEMPSAIGAVDFNPSDQMIYGVVPEANRVNKFYRINPLTGSVHFIASVTLPAGGDGTIDSIGFANDGSLFAYDEHFDMFSGRLLSINLAASSASIVGSSGTPSCLGGDYDPERSTYWVSDEWQGKVYQLHPTNSSIVWTSTSTWYTGVGIGDLFNVDAAPDGYVYIVASESGSTKLLKLDPSTGTWVVQCNLPQVSDPWGFKIASVPFSAIDDLVFVGGGTLPSSSLLGAKKVGDFYMGRFEVTWKKWREVRDYAAANGYDLAGVGRGTASPDFPGPDLDVNPVHSLNWYQALKWCNAKSESEGLAPVYKIDGAVYRTGELVPLVDPLADGYRLPTEAEWEWAARGGIRSLGTLYSGSDNLDEVGWYWNNSSDGTKAVGSKKGNELGLFDMSGNAIEWCQDLLGESRAYRGGGWGNDAPLCTPFARFAQASPTLSFWDLGLRVVRNASGRDTDRDGANDYREVKDGTDPNDPTSFNPLSKGLAAYYPFEGNANDESGYGNNGTVSGAVLADNRLGQASSAYSFDGSDDFISIDPIEPLAGLSGSVTVTAWVRNEGLSAPSYGTQDLQGIFGPATYLANNADGGFGLRLLDPDHDSFNSRRYSFTVGAPRQDLNSSTVVPENVWDFVVASYDGNTLSIYRNGILDASQVVGAGLTRSMNTAGNYFTIGQFVDRVGMETQPFRGKIDDVRVYSRALSASEAASLYGIEAGSLDSDGDGLTDAWERGFGRFSVVWGSFDLLAAQQDAATRGGKLASFSTAAEWYAASSSLPENLFAWIGATDSSSEGVWRWFDGTDWAFSNWATGEPNNQDGIEHYAQVWGNFFPGQPNAWNDVHAGVASSYVIEYGFPTDPTNSDSDVDGLKDGVETGTGVFLSAANTGTNPLDSDTSGDGILDGEAVLWNFNPLTDHTQVLAFLRHATAVQSGRFGLYTESSIMDLNLGGVMLQKTGTQASVRFKVLSKMDLRDPAWTDRGTYLLPPIDMPGSKGFLRIRALGPQ